GRCTDGVRACRRSCGAMLCGELRQYNCQDKCVPKYMGLSRFSGHGIGRLGRREPMNHEKKNKREKRVYDEAFRREAVALLQSSDKPLVQIAAELGVSQWNLRDWRKQYGDSSGRRKPGKTAGVAAQSELERLRERKNIE